MRSEIRSEIPQMDLHALSTIIPPTLRTFLPLWHNVLPTITLDCHISGEIERYTEKESVWFIYIIMWFYFQVWISLDHSHSLFYLPRSLYSIARSPPRSLF